MEREAHMNKSQKSSIIFATLILVALVISFLGINYLEPPPFERRPTHPPPPPENLESYYTIREDIQLYYTIRVVLSTINATLLIFLFSAYLGLYRKMKSDFALGLMVFSVILLFYALSSNPLVQRVFGFFAFGLGPFAMLPELFTCVALVVLLYLTFKY